MRRLVTTRPGVPGLSMRSEVPDRRMCNRAFRRRFPREIRDWPRPSRTGVQTRNGRCAIPHTASRWRRWRRSGRRLLQHRERVDRRALPPALVVGQHEDREVQVRGRLGGVPGSADVADHLAARHRRAFDEPGGVAFEMRVVIGVGRRRIELVDGDAARPCC